MIVIITQEWGMMFISDAARRWCDVHYKKRQVPAIITEVDIFDDRVIWTQYHETIWYRCYYEGSVRTRREEATRITGHHILKEKKDEDMSFLTAFSRMLTMGF